MRYFERFDATLVMEYLLTNSKRAGIPHPNRPSEKCHSRLDRESRISEKWLRYWIPAPRFHEDKLRGNDKNA